MYIRKLSIKNFRNFGDPPFVVELKPFTLILGENNIGKTNLLIALSLIFSQEITIFRQRTLEIDDINYRSVLSFKEAVSNLTVPAFDVIFPEVRIDVFMTELNDKQLAAASDWPMPGDKSLSEAMVSYVFAPRTSLDKVEWVNVQRNRLEALPDQDLVDFVDFPIGEYRYSLFGRNDPSHRCDLHYLNMFRMDLLDALRDAKNELIAAGNSRLLFRILNQRDLTKYADIKAILGELKRVIDGNTNLASVVSDVEKLLERVLLRSQDSDNSVAFRFTSPETAEMLKKLSLQYGLSPIDVARNGLGRNNLLYISLVLSHLSASDNQNNEVVFRLVAIEEPEAHLHPHLQDHLAENIQAIQSDSGESMQLLLTSHSTNIAAKLDLTNTVIVYHDHRFNRIENHYVLSNLDIDQEQSSIRYLSKFLDATKSRMFFARKLILVEGISEQILIPLLFRLHFGYSVERVGCNVVNVQGVAFRHFLCIIRSGYFIKCLVLTDSDSGTDASNRAQDLKSEYSGTPTVEVQISTLETFERDLIAANCSGQGAVILKRALQTTRPRLGKTYVERNPDMITDIDEFFSLIEAHKSEFSFNLSQELIKRSEGFNIPSYISTGFQFIE